MVGEIEPVGGNVLRNNCEEEEDLFVEEKVGKGFPCFVHILPL